MAKLVIQQNNSHRDSQSYGKKGWWRMVIINLTFIIIYFILSIGLTFFQKWFFMGFKYPLSVVVCHLLIKYICSVVYRSIWQCANNRRRITLDWTDHLFRLAPIGIASGLDIGLSNWGIERIPVTLYTMTKSTTIVFILGFALLFKLEKKSWSVVVIVGLISCGLGMFTYRSSQFDSLGFSLVLFASFASGLRWTLIQFMMQRPELSLRHPIDMCYHVQPWMVFSVLPTAIIFEGASAVNGVDSTLVERNLTHAMNISFLVFIGAFVALAMELCEYNVVSRTSSLTLSIVGIIKEIFTLVLDAEWNGNQMTKLNFIGLLVLFGGIVSHVIHKALKTRAESSRIPGKNLDEASAHFLADDSSSDEENPNDDSSTEVLFSVLNSRDRYLSSLGWNQTDAKIEPMYFNELTPSLRKDK
uniref:Sugar phosphate transporter domain-containing protein n=2 Tax=Clastoptera arizonana TaxID=38151 RepID=A0A1B6DWT4_9HEMI